MEQRTFSRYLKWRLQCIIYLNIMSSQTVELCSGHNVYSTTKSGIIYVIATKILTHIQYSVPEESKINHWIVSANKLYSMSIKNVNILCAYFVDLSNTNYSLRNFQGFWKYHLQTSRIQIAAGKVDVLKYLRTSLPIVNGGWFTQLL